MCSHPTPSDTRREPPYDWLNGAYNYGPALSAITKAKAKLQGGDTNVMEQLQVAETQIRAAQIWSRGFIGHTYDDTAAPKA